MAEVKRREGKEVADGSQERAPKAHKLLRFQEAETVKPPRGFAPMHCSACLNVNKLRRTKKQQLWLIQYPRGVSLDLIKEKELDLDDEPATTPKVVLRFQQDDRYFIIRELPCATALSQVALVSDGTTFQATKPFQRVLSITEDLAALVEADLKAHRKIRASKASHTEDDEEEQEEPELLFQQQQTQNIKEEVAPVKQEPTELEPVKQEPAEEKEQKLTPAVEKTPKKSKKKSKKRTKRPVEEFSGNKDSEATEPEKKRRKKKSKTKKSKRSSE
ncbi:MAG: hypothetical protein MHM6MM_005110 [Cercozoa sp. M6MM]